MSNKGRWLVTWDFSTRPLSTFYSLLDELSKDGGLHYAQKSVYIARDAETAQELVQLCKWYGAGVVNAVALTDGSLDQAASPKEAAERIARRHELRLSRRGRKPGLKKRRKE